MWSAARRAEAGELGKSWCPGERGRTQAPLNTEASSEGQGTVRGGRRILRRQQVSVVTCVFACGPVDPRDSMYPRRTKGHGMK